MTTQKKCSPALRFAGFTDDWEQRKLGDIAKFLNGRAYKQEELLSKGKYPVLRVGNFNTNSHWYYSNLELHEKFYAKKGDLLYTWATIFEPYIWEKETVIYHYHIWKIDLSPNLNPLFTLQLLKSDNSLSSNTNGSTMIHITKLEIENQIVNIPELKEQTQIGNFFKQLDETIALHKRKLKKQQNLKKFYLEKMFPKENSLFPEIRFPNFTDAWEQRKLGEISENFDNLRVPVAENLRKEGKTAYFGANGIQGFIDGFTHDGEFVLIAEDGANDLKNYPVQYVTGKIWVNNHAHVLQGIPLVLNNLFLTYRIKSMDISKYLVGGGRAKLNASTMKEINICFPNVSEQTQIGNFFKQLDETIALHKRMIEKLEKIKQAYLKRMFT